MSLFKSIFEKLSANVGTVDGQTQAKLGRVVPDASRCVQCGICGYNCPVGIPVRDYARRGLPVEDPRCIACGNCIQVCPRGTLRWETENHALVRANFTLTASQPTSPLLTTKD